MAQLRITLFGKFSARRDGKVLLGFESQKVQEFFSYLLLNRGRPHAREVLASLLWDYGSTTQSRRYLRRVLWQLHKALHDPTHPDDDQILKVGTEWIRLDVGVKTWLDVAVFEAAYNQARGVAGQLLSHETAQILERAVGLYTSDLLENMYQDWCLYQRERFQNMYLAMLDKLMDYCEVNRKYELGLEYGGQILHIDRAREHTHRRIMQLLYLAGDRTDALRQYEHCIAVLKEELDVKPSKSTVMLYEQIRADQVEAFFQRKVPGQLASDEARAALPEPLHHFQILQQILTNVQMRLQHEIEMIEHTHYDGK